MIEGFTNTSGLDLLAGNIKNALDYLYEDIPICKDFKIVQEVYVLDERNSVWKGRIVVQTENFVEGI